MSYKIGVVDTMFARYDMAKDVLKVLDQYTGRLTYERYTVPGIKDLPVASKIMFNQRNCDLVIALGMPGPKDYDKVSAKTASDGLMQVQLSVEKHIIEVFVHEDEGEGDDTYLKQIMQHRASAHALNGINLLLNPEKLQEQAGKGIRQGYPDASTIY